LIIWYLGFMIAGDICAYFLGLLVEYQWGSQASLIAFLLISYYFGWIGEAGLR